LKRLFAFLRTFAANEARIFYEFESFAKGFIDVEKPRFSVGLRRPITGRRHASAVSQPDVHHDPTLWRTRTDAAFAALALV
jgi:hypothetical protein